MTYPNIQCLAYLRDKQLLKHLPASVGLDDDEARAEREAIQGEGV